MVNNWFDSQKLGFAILNEANKIVTMDYRSKSKAKPGNFYKECLTWLYVIIKNCMKYFIPYVVAIKLSYFVASLFLKFFN